MNDRPHWFTVLVIVAAASLCGVGLSECSFDREVKARQPSPEVSR